MNVSDRDRTVRLKHHVNDFFSKLLKTFHDYCFFNMSDQLFEGIALNCFGSKNYKNIVFPDSMTIEQYFCCEESLGEQKNSLNAQKRSLHDCKIPQQNCEN